MPFCWLTPVRFLWCQVLTVTSCHMIYKAQDSNGTSPTSVATLGAASNATFAANFAARIPTAARNVKVHQFDHCLSPCPASRYLLAG